MVKKVAWLAFGAACGQTTNSLGMGQVGLALLIAVNRPRGAKGLNLHLDMDVARTFPCDHHGASEFLLQRHQEGAARTELRRADADARAVANLVARIE